MSRGSPDYVLIVQNNQHNILEDDISPSITGIGGTYEPNHDNKISILNDDEDDYLGFYLNTTSFGHTTIQNPPKICIADIVISYESDDGAGLPTAKIYNSSGETLYTYEISSPSFGTEYVKRFKIQISNTNYIKFKFYIVDSLGGVGFWRIKTVKIYYSS